MSYILTSDLTGFRNLSGLETEGPHPMTSTPPFIPGEYYHVYNRGNNSENLFVEAANYDYFLSLYNNHIRPFADTFAY